MLLFLIVVDPDVNFHVTVESIRNVNDKAKTIDVELRMMVDWKDSRIGFNNSNPAVSKSVMRSRKYLSACLWYPMADIFNFVSGVQNTMFEEYQKVLLKKTPNNDEVCMLFHFKSQKYSKKVFYLHLTICLNQKSRSRFVLIGNIL